MLPEAYVLLFVLNPLAVVVAVALSRRITKGEIMSDVQAAVDEVVAQLGKAKVEIVTRIADVEAQLVAAQVPAEQVDLSALKAAAQALDDVVADAAVEEPSAEEVPAEEA